ncbi:MAG: carotenoid biosynthesis protein [Bacteroidota bacterium]
MNNQANILNKENGAIFLVWLFHISAIIGIALGHFEWFVSKTPLNLIVISLVMFVAYPVTNKASLGIAWLFYLTGMSVEWVGVHYDILFGSYAYGENLGPKVDGVPWVIGLNWVILTFVTAAISTRLFKNIWIRIFIGATMMVFLDFFIEQTAPILDFWEFSGGYAPIQNYLAWLAISAFLHYLYQRSLLLGSFTVSIHIYLAQLIFFIFLYGYLSV